MKIVLERLKSESCRLIIFLLFLISLLPVSFIRLEYVNIAHAMRILYIASIGMLFLMSVIGGYKLNKNELWFIVLIAVWGLSIIPAETRRNSVVYIIEFVIKGYILAFIIPRLIKNVAAIKTILKWIVFLAAIMVIIGIVELSADYNILFHKLYLQYNDNYLEWFRSAHRGGIISTIGHALPFANYLLICFSLAWCLYYCTEKKIYVVVAVLLAAAVFLSLSRSSAAILVLLVIVMSIFYFNKIRKILLYALLLVFIFISAVAMLPKYRKIIAIRYAPEVLIQDITNSPRYYAYFAAYNILKDYPIFGVGPGNAGRYLSHDKYRDPRLPDKYKKVWSIPDNMYLSILIETGVLGFGVFLLFLGNFFRNFRNAYRKSEYENKKLFLGLGVGLSAFLLNILFYDGFNWFAPNLLFWCLWGLSQALINISHTERSSIK